MTPDELVASALDVAEAGLAAGELPIGAVVAVGDKIVGRAYTQEAARDRRLVHADLLAMVAADRALGRRPHSDIVVLAVSLEPCVMCVGAALTLGVSEIHFALESPDDGGTELLPLMLPRRPGGAAYTSVLALGGWHRAEAVELFRRYCATAPDSGHRRWARSLAGLPDEPPGPLSPR